MTAVQTRKTVLAIMKEVTEGTPVEPTGATDFVALQSGFSMEPNTETQQNDELRSSLGEAKPILGSESPTASFNHYLRHSGVEGQAPNFSHLIESAIGTKTVNSTQRSTTSGSSTTVAKLAAGGSDFARGFAVLLKDPTNGYSIRNVLSVSTNDLTLAFPLGNAPGSGVGAGKCVNFKPADTGHPSLSIWLYRGNGGAKELGMGMKVNSMTIDIQARRLINMSFGLEGSAYAFNPIIITSSTRYLDFNDGSDLTAALTPGVYKDPNDLAEALQAAMNAAGSSDTFTVIYNNTGAKAGKFTISTNGAALSLKFSTGTNTANTIAPKIGFAVADETSATSYDSDAAITFAAPYAPAFDDSDPLSAKDNEVFFGNGANPGITSVQSVRVNFNNSLVTQEDVTKASGIESKMIDRRTITVDMRFSMKQADSSAYRNYQKGNNVQFAYNFGVKAGVGNWVPGKCGNIFMPSAVISRYSITDLNGVATVDAQLTAYVDSNGNGEFYMNFL
jgi:hypothetical protein